MLFVLWNLALKHFIHLLQLIFVYVERDNEDVGKPVSDYFGVTGYGPKVSPPPLFVCVYVPSLNSACIIEYRLLKALSLLKTLFLLKR